LSPQSRVLIVDASAESREVLRTLLEREGAETLEASEACRATHIVRQWHPHLVVYDAESERAPSFQAWNDLGRTTTRNDIPIVVLGTAKRHIGPLPTGQFVSKPYHYGPLIRKIEGLLDKAA
jgi:CheY-like chemotaxis protein